jgi:Sulfotransferase domain
VPTNTPPPYSVRGGASRGRARTKYLSPWKLRAILAWNETRWLARRATSFARPGPAFVIVGAAKAGTTSLLAYLAEQPDIGVSIRKEVRYFDFNYDEGSGWYRAHFPSVLFWLKARLRTGHWPQVGESTPFYLNHPKVPARIHAFDPRMKLVVLWRDPGVRAHSHYEHSVRGGEEDLPFLEALDAEAARLEPERRALEESESFIPMKIFLQGYLDGSRYGEHLERWLQHFPREQILVLRAEDLFDRPAEVCAAVSAFLGVPATRLPDYPVRNSAEYAKPPAEWIDEARERLRGDTEAFERILSRTSP